MLGKVSRIIEFLALDGGWHTVEEVAGALGQKVEQTSELLGKLSTFNLVEFDEQGRVRVEHKLRRLLQ